MDRESEVILAPGTRIQSGPHAGIRVLFVFALSPCSLRSFNHVRAQFLRLRPQECDTIGMGLLLLCLAWLVFVIVPLVSMKPRILLSCSSSSLPGLLFAGLESSILGSVVILTASECLSRAPTRNRTNPAMMRFPLGSDALNIKSSKVSTALTFMGDACTSSRLVSRLCIMLPAIRSDPVSQELAFIDRSWMVTLAALMKLSALVAGAHVSLRNEQ